MVEPEDAPRGKIPIGETSSLELKEGKIKTHFYKI